MPASRVKRAAKGIDRRDNLERGTLRVANSNLQGVSVRKYRYELGEVAYGNPVDSFSRVIF